MTVNQTCRFLSNGYRFEMRGQWSAPDPRGYVECNPCCKWEGPVVSSMASVEDFQKYRNTIGSIDSFKSHHCNLCNYTTGKNIKNMREFSYSFIPEDAEFGDPTFLEIQLDKTCNAACIMCGPHFSSLWQQELRKHGQHVTEAPKIDFLSIILRKIDIQKTRRIHFLGGEPFLSNHDTRALSLIKQPELVKVHYNTNGSIYPSAERQALWKNFKKVIIVLSIDDVDQRFEYIRYPLKWQQVHDNIRRMQDTLPNNVILGICRTANIFNLYYHHEFESWYETVGKSWPTEPTYNLAYGSFCPTSVTEKFYQRLSERYDSNHIVMRTVKDTALNPAKMLAEISAIDQRRNLDWRTVFPEIADCF